MSATPAQLLLAIAEHGSLDAACEDLGIEREEAVRLLREAARKLGAAPKERAAAQKELPGLERSAGADGKRVRVFSDGAARGNPGPAGAGAVVLDPRGRVLARVGKFLGKQTNNVAEYEGVILGLARAKELGATEVDVRADSLLLIRQLEGVYQVKNAALKALHAKAKGLLRSFERVDLRHVPREENTLADEMSNRAIDERME
ncbi:MAG: ribonuclease HI family protein [Deltaproteobacteria bacterium]|nr:MAG: ribonuclease HI family protein [Deltaproteobacteria bacterium]